MQNHKQTQITKAQDIQTALPDYISPEIIVYNEDELLKTVAVLGCSPFCESD